MTSKATWITLVGAGAALAIGAGFVLIAPQDDSAASASTTETTSLASAFGDQSAAVSSFWDSTEVHTISLAYDEAEYDAMIDTYLSSAEKEWITADVVIDGVEFSDVGLKLKGNSSLRDLSTEPDAELSSTDPVALPWIITLDKYVDGQNYDGATELVIRGNNTETALNEALALELLAASGLAAEEASAAEFEINGESTLRLIVENPNDEWADREFDSAAALYKAESGGDYSYRGEDAEAYDDIFDQEAGDDDLAPLTAFLEFINESSDEQFAAELDQWLDVDSFATYLAFQELVGNYDDIDGPGNNSYLAYDDSTGLMTVASWDLNLAFGVVNEDQGGGQIQGQAGAAEPGVAAEGTELPEEAELPEGTELPEGAELPGAGAMRGGAAMPGGAAPDDAALPDGPQAAPGGEVDGGVRPGGAGIGAGAVGGVNGAAGGGMQGSNILSERFLADASFAALYEAELDRLQEALFASGLAQTALDQWGQVLASEASDLIETSTVEQEAADVASEFPTAS